MINNEVKGSKLKPLLDKVKDIESKYGTELCDVLLSRIKLKILKLFEEFEVKSKQSFETYWDKNSELKDRFLNLEVQTQNSSDNEKDKIPKFIEEFESKNKN